MNIGSKNGYPASALSNFSPHPFVLDGVEIASMEGFLQSLKFKNPEMQKYVCTLVGKMAKAKGREKNWWRDGYLYWKGCPIDRFGEVYQHLLDIAYEAMFKQSESFRNALRASGSATLVHTIGKTNTKETILTQSEFCSRLMKLKERII